jgi:glycosyltransferase involved in cell wall biosynthesis
MKKQPIALYLPSLRGGGAERVMVTLANGFVARGLDIDLVLAKAEGPFLSEVDSRVRIIDLDASRVICSLPGLVRYLRRERPFAMLSALNHANIIAAWACIVSRISLRLVLSEHSTLTRSLAGYLSCRIRILPKLMSLTYPYADAVVAVSSGAADDLAAAIKLPRERIYVIHNPVVTPAMLKKSREPIDHRWFRPGEPPVILGVGRIVRPKDFSVLIRAFAKLREQREARLMILGEGEERLQLEALVSELGVGEYVLMPGFVANPYAYMHQTALFVLSSAWEGFGNVIVEAMACGTPVVSTDCLSGPAEILENGRWGRLVPVGDATALTAAIIATLDDPKHPDIVRRSLDFSMDAAVERYLKVLGVTA